MYCSEQVFVTLGIVNQSITYSSSAISKRSSKTIFLRIFMFLPLHFLFFRWEKNWFYVFTIFKYPIKLFIFKKLFHLFVKLMKIKLHQKPAEFQCKNQVIKSGIEKICQLFQRKHNRNCTRLPVSCNTASYFIKTITSM